MILTGIERDRGLTQNAPPASRRSAVCTAIFLLAVFVSCPPARAETKPPDEDHTREEEGVNPYTVPSIARIFSQLDALKPLSFDRLHRDIVPVSHSSREHLGLAFGGLVADGFLIVACEKKGLVDDLGRALIRQARSLGVAERVIRHSKSLTELGDRSDWPAVRNELQATQTDVEEAMVELHDQKMAHLISLGGWLRGLEISAGAVTAEFSASRAKLLWQPDLVDYFDAEMKTLPPALTTNPLFVALRTGVAKIHATLNQSLPNGLTAAEVKSVYDQAHDINLLIQHGDAPSAR